MKRSKSSPPQPVAVAQKLVALGLLTAGALQAQEVFTRPVGYVKLGNTTAGAPAVAANKDVYLSIPLESKLQAVGVVASTTATTITFENSPAWTVGQWDANPTPYFATISSGAENGLRAVISSNDSDTLTVSLSSPGDLTSVSAGDTVEIRECWTLQTFFASMNLPAGTQVFVYDETKISINQTPSVIYIFSGANWFENQGAFTPSDDVVLYAGETFVLRSGAEIPSLITAGEVSSSSLRVSVIKDVPTAEEDLFIASMSPVPVLVTDSGLPVQNGDQLFVYDAATTTGINPSPETFIYGNGMWFNNATFAEVTGTLTFSPGAGYVVRRAANSPTFEEWTQLTPY